jgi:hypothetical protein
MRRALIAILWTLAFAPAAWAGGALLLLPAPDSRPQLFPQLADDGRGAFLLVWQQGRLYYQQEEGDIFALRLDSEGRPLGEALAVCTAVASQERPRVVRSGAGFLVVWQDLRNGRDWDVYGARVDGAGHLLDPQAILIAGGAGNQASAEVAPAGNGWLVVWQHHDGRYYEIRTAFVSRDGEVGTVRPLAFRKQVLHGGSLTLGASGDGWLLFWMDERDWAPGVPGMITRRFARLTRDAGSLHVREIYRPSSAALATEGGRFVSGPGGASAFVGWGQSGRGRLIPQALVFDGPSVTPRRNPNGRVDLGISGWNSEQSFFLFAHNVQVDGPVAAAFGDRRYVVAARTRSAARQGDATVYRIIGSAFDPDGRRRIDPGRLPVFHESGMPLANPVLGAGRDGFVLVFEEGTGLKAGKIRFE